MLILHYLGLDHIGHVEGPFSAKVPGKLKEMDTNIKQIDLAISEWVRKTLIFSITIIAGKCLQLIIIYSFSSIYRAKKTNCRLF